MFALRLAALCLLQFALLRAGSGDPPASELLVQLRGDAGQPAHTLEIMKRELAPLMSAAGYRVAWRVAHEQSVSTPDTLVVVELRGSCGMPAGSEPLGGAADTHTLATTASSDGVVLPFSAVNCGALTRVLAPYLASDAGARRDFLYGRAMARLLAHELYHILAHTRDHDREGIAKSHFSFTDLLTEQFEFEPTALARFQHPSADEGPTATATEALSGR